AAIMNYGAPVLGLSPTCLADLYADMAATARITAAYSKGREVIGKMRSEISLVRGKASDSGKPVVYCAEWGKPLILSQKWVAELVEAAGGEFYGDPGKQILDEQVQEANPDVIVAAWCGAGDRVPLEKIVS